MKKPDLKFKWRIRLGYSDLHGRGVFATEDIKEGELIERAPLVIMAFRMNYHKDPVIWSYMFTNTCPCDECKKHGGHFLMVMGYGQIYNHQDNNSAEISFNLQGETADIVALRDIKKGEEIFVSYGSNYFKTRKKIDLNDIKNKDVSSNDVEGAKVEQVNNVFETSLDKSKVFKPL